MAHKPVIKARAIVQDIRSGIPDSKLMEKYRLSHKGLQSIFNKLIESGAMSLDEVFERTSEYVDTVEIDQSRRKYRKYLEIVLPIYDISHPERSGAVRDLSPNGVGTRALRVERGESLTLVIKTDELFMIDPIAFGAKCRWAKMTKDQTEQIAGFKITRISDEMQARLDKLLQVIAL